MSFKIFNHQNKNEDVFDEIRELSDPPIDSNATDTFKAQKDSKEIVKIVHVTSVVHLLKLQQYFLCAKKTKIMSLFNYFFSSVSDFKMFTTVPKCVCILLLVNKVQCIQVLR